MELGDLAPEGHDVIAGKLGVELFGVAAARPDGGSDGAWGPRVADSADRGDQALLLAGQQLLIEIFAGQPRGHHDHAVRRGLGQLAGVSAGQRHLAGADRGERGAGAERDAGEQQPALDLADLQRVDGPGRHLGGGRHDLYVEALVSQQFRDDAAQVVMVVVVHDHAGTRGPRPGHDVVRGEQAGAGLDGDRLDVPAGDAISPPRRAGGDGDVLELELDDVVGAHPALAVDLDVGHRRDSLLAVVQYPRPGGQAGQPRLPGNAPAKVPRGLREHDVVAPNPQGARRLEPGWPRADDEDPRVGVPRPDPLGVPAPAELLAHARVLRAPDRRHREVAGDADVAADALADRLQPARADLLGQERVGDRGPRGADEVEDAGLHLVDHGVRRREPADADDRLGGQLLKPYDVLLLLAFRAEAGGVGIRLPRAQHEVPQVRQFAELTQDLRDVAAGEA